MPNESLFQGSKDVFLAKVRADFDALENQSIKSFNAFSQFSLMGTDPMATSLFVTVPANTNDGDRAVWRHVGTSGVESEGTRNAGGAFPRASFIRTYETEVFDPDNQIANSFHVPQERLDKEGNQYASILNRAQKLLTKMDRTNIQDPFEVFNLAFTAPASHPDRFFVRGNAGLDGNKTALGERLISTQHALANGSTTVSNAVQASGTARAFSDDAYWASREQANTFKDDIGDDMPMFGGQVTIMVPNANGLVRLALEINQTADKIGTANNDVNVNQGTLGRMISSPALLSSKRVTGVANTFQWFLIDETTRDPEVGSGFICIDFVPLTTNTYFDDATRSVVYTINQTKVYGWADWRNIMGSLGSGAAYTS